MDYPKSIFNHFFETFVKSPDATWALLSHTSGLVVFLIIVNAPSKRRWLVFILLCGVCFLWGLKSLGVPETAWASTTNAAGYTLMLIAAITCLGLSFIGGSVVATRHVLGLLKRSVMRGADQQMIDDVMQSPLLNVVISRHMRELSKDACCSGDVNGGSYSGEYHGEGQSLNEKVSQASPIAASHQQQQQQQQQRHQSIVCSSSPCPSCISLVQQLRRQVAELQAAAASTSSAHAQQRSIFMHPPASCSLPPPLNSSHMTIRCIDGRTVQVCRVTVLLCPWLPSRCFFRSIFRITSHPEVAACMLPAKQMLVRPMTSTRQVDLHARTPSSAKLLIAHLVNALHRCLYFAFFSADFIASPRCAVHHSMLVPHPAMACSCPLSHFLLAIFSRGPQTTRRAIQWNDSSISVHSTIVFDPESGHKKHYEKQ